MKHGRSEEQILREVRATLRSEPRSRPEERVELDYADGTLTIAGEVHDVAVKRLFLERVAGHPAVKGIVDRLRVAPAEHMGDGRIRDLVRDALLEEAALAEMTIRVLDKGLAATARQPEPSRGDIKLRVEDGVVTLDGDVPSLSHKRLAGVLAWWVPGSRDVINGLGVWPPEEDRDEEITDAVRLALEKDPFVNASQVRVTTNDCVVTLMGIVPKQAEREMAERDAWYVFGVDNVKNEIEVRPAEAMG